MILRFCVVVPCYNNPETIRGVVEECLVTTKFPVLVVDDGSDLPIQPMLPQSDRVQCLTFSRNRGKGAALRKAIAHCVATGFTHMITVDGDAQHRPAEISKMVKSAIQNPWDIIIGERSWNAASVPEISKFGRQFSNFWVWYQTGEDVKDSQSGFRIYPLFHLQTLRFYTRRFDFELESLVRCLWQGVGITATPVACYYPDAKQRVSHFDKLWDNARITAMNIVLIVISLFRRHLQPLKITAALFLSTVVGYFTGSFWVSLAVLSATTFILQLNGWLNVVGGLSGLYALPLLVDGRWHALFCAGLGATTVGAGAALVQMKVRQLQKTWSGRMRGGTFGNWLIKQISWRLGHRASYLCMIFVVPYFYCFAPKAKLASMQLFRVMNPQVGFWRVRWQVIKHFYRFSTLLLDRLYQSNFSEIKFKTTSLGRENMIAVVNQDLGGVIVGAHFGALDIAARTMGQKGYTDKMVRAEFFAASGVTVHRVLGDAKHSHKDLQTLPMEQQSLLHFRQMILSGTGICLMGDRPMTNQYELVPFLGKLAAFDTTPFRVAALCETTLHYCYGIKLGRREYEFRATTPRQLKFDRLQDKALQLYDWVADFAEHLGEVVREDPYQWSNFYPFWSALPTSPQRANLGQARCMLYEDLHDERFVQSQPQDRTHLRGRILPRSQQRDTGRYCEESQER